MSLKEMNSLLKAVKAPYKMIDDSCDCEYCKSKGLHNLWKVNDFFEMRLKINESVLKELEDLIEGTRFILNIDNILEAHRVK